MKNESIRAFVELMVKEKNLSGVEKDVIDEVIEELSGHLETQINRALIDALNDEQVAEFEKLVDGNDTQAVSSFFTDKGLPVQDIVTQAMARFRAAYLKA